MSSFHEVTRGYTIAIIKPHAMPKQKEITARIVNNGFVVAQSVKIQISDEQAAKLYTEHATKSFYGALCKSMTSGPVFVMKLVRMDDREPVAEFRQILGSTNPAFAAPGTLRADFANRDPAKLEENAVHGSDSEESARREFEIFAKNLVSTI